MSRNLLHARLIPENPGLGLSKLRFGSAWSDVLAVPRHEGTAVLNQPGELLASALAHLVRYVVRKRLDAAVRGLPNKYNWQGFLQFTSM